MGSGRRREGCRKGGEWSAESSGELMGEERKRTRVKTLGHQVGHRRPLCSHCESEASGCLGGVGRGELQAGARGWRVGGGVKRAGGGGAQGERDLCSLVVVMCAWEGRGA